MDVPKQTFLDVLPAFRAALDDPKAVFIAFVSGRVLSFVFVCK